MFERIRHFVLRMLRVPAMPDAPWGAPESMQVFRAGRNFYKLRVLRWSVGQVLTLAGIIFWIVLLNRWERDFEAARAEASQAAAAHAAGIPQPPATAEATAPSGSTPTRGKARKRPSGAVIAARSPAWVFPVLRALELIGLIGYFAQIPLTYALLRLDYELRWYIVTDRSLRIRHGLWRVQESTMSFANLQQVAVTQGPLQRWLKLADVRVQSAGGGGEESSRHRGQDLHTGIFHGVANAPEIRDFVLERLRQYRASGLGDPDDTSESSRAHDSDGQVRDPALAAAKELLTEAQSLRRTLG